MNAHVLLTNTRGDYLALGADNVSTYHGLFFREGTTFMKTLMNILPDVPLESLSGEKIITRTFANARQRFTLLEKGLLMHTSGTFTLTLDCKRLYDESEHDRWYDVKTEHAKQYGGETLGSVTMVRVVYRKGDAYEIQCSIATTMSVTTVGSWRQTTYTYDNERGTNSTPWVYDAITLEGEGLVAFAKSDHDAFDLLLQKHTLDVPEQTRDKRQIAADALLALKTRSGVMAGLPWFYREWSRDELIACGGLLKIGEVDHVITILDKWYRAVRDDGTLPAIYPDEGLTSVDAPGWLAKRTLDLLAYLRVHGGKQRLQPFVSSWRSALEKLLAALDLREGLVWNGANETWMDTTWQDDGRAGARIEIQALAITMCDAYASLSGMLGEPGMETVQPLIISSVYDRLVQEGVLLDGLNSDGTPDLTIRPNIFLAWYIAPRLFTAEEWLAFFERALSDLWLAWGGIASISTRDNRFLAEDTGEDTRAYHRGDSWYFINNIVALALAAVDPEGYADEISSITSASTSDLHQGFLHHASEISSASHQTPKGCWAQAWSASTLVELLSR